MTLRLLLYELKTSKKEYNNGISIFFQKIISIILILHFKKIEILLLLNQ